MSLRGPVLHATPILRPTQLSVGTQEVRRKRDKWRKKKTTTKTGKTKAKASGGWTGSSRSCTRGPRDNDGQAARTPATDKTKAKDRQRRAEPSEPPAVNASQAENVVESRAAASFAAGMRRRASPYAGPASAYVGPEMSAAGQLAPRDLYITPELHRRAPKRVDHLGEKLALQDIAAPMVDDPEQVLPKLVEKAMEMTGACRPGSAPLRRSKGRQGSSVGVN